MKIAITGANGFIGKKLAENLKKKGIEVTAISRKRNKKGEYTNEFLLNFNGINYLEDVDVLIHCAARVHQMKENKEEAPKLYQESNVETTIRLAHLAAKSGVKKFIFLSSIKVNGEETKKNEFFCEKSIENPLDYYSKSKYAAERSLLLINEKLKIVIIRPPLVYGPGVGANFRRILWATNKELPLPFNNIDNKRSFIYVENLIAFIYECCKNKEADNQIFTISDNQDLSTSELIKKLGYFMNKRTRLFHINKYLIKFLFKILRKEETFNKLYSSLQINPKNSFKKIKFDLPYSLDDGLKKTVDWYKNFHNKTNNLQ